MYLVYILKHLIEKAYARFFKTIFLFDNWQQFKSIMRKKKEQTPSQNYWPAHPKPRAYCWVGVCLCLHGSHGTRVGASSVPCPPARVRGYSLWSHWAQVPLGKLLFWFEALFFLASPSFQTPPNSQVFCLNKQSGYKSCPPFKIHWEIETA